MHQSLILFNESSAVIGALVAAKSKNAKLLQKWGIFKNPPQVTAPV